MWRKEIIITKHVKERFEERNISFKPDKPRSIESQIRYDLRALNVRYKIKLADDIYRVITKQGKTYIIQCVDNEKILIKTVYTKDLKRNTLRYLEINERRDRRRRRRAANE